MEVSLWTASRCPLSAAHHLVNLGLKKTCIPISAKNPPLQDDDILSHFLSPNRKLQLAQFPRFSWRPVCWTRQDVRLQPGLSWSEGWGQMWWVSVLSSITLTYQQTSKEGVCSHRGFNTYCFVLSCDLCVSCVTEWIVCAGDFSSTGGSSGWTDSSIGSQGWVLHQNATSKGAASLHHSPQLLM